MKKHLLLLAFSLVGLLLYGQNKVPNGNFESWYSQEYENPQYYPYSSNIENFYRNQLPFNVEKTTDAYHGTYALQLSTVANETDTSFGYIINFIPEEDPSSWKGGIPYSEMPTGIRGYYKYNVATADSATIMVIFSKSGTNIGTYAYFIGGVKDTYTLFDFTFEPALSQTPDSVAFGAISCKFSADKGEPGGPAGSILKLDSITFTGVINQPAELNGDFELWEADTLNVPLNWYVENQLDGFNRISESASGDYAVELITTLGSRNNDPIARSGRISTGYYDDNCKEGCQQKGGSPFINQIDTLTLLYKYFPSGDDSALVYISFKKDGLHFWGNEYILHASATYKLAEFPFNCGQIPDSIIIDIQSSHWKDTLVSFVGSQLIIDSLKFKSEMQPTGLSDFKKFSAITISPNPSFNGKFLLQGLSAGVQAIEVYDLHGVKIYSSKNYSNQKFSEIDISRSPRGIYFLKIYEKGKAYTQKIIRQ